MSGSARRRFESLRDDDTARLLSLSAASVESDCDEPDDPEADDPFAVERELLWRFATTDQERRVVAASIVNRYERNAATTPAREPLPKPPFERVILLCRRGDM